MNSLSNLMKIRTFFTKSYMKQLRLDLQMGPNWVLLIQKMALQRLILHFMVVSCLMNYLMSIQSHLKSIDFCFFAAFLNNVNFLFMILIFCYILIKKNYIKIKFEKYFHHIK